MSGLDDRLARLRARWPEVGRQLDPGAALQKAVTVDTPHPVIVHGGLHVSSAFDPASEARLQASRVSDSACEAWIYGIGCGRLAETLLARPALQRLHLVSFNLRLLVESLDTHEHTWLDDPRATLHCAAEFDYPRAPFAAILAELQLAEPAGAPLRDRVRLELEEPARIAALRTRQANYDRPNIESNRARLAATLDIGAHFDTARGGTIAVIAGGPSARDFLRAPHPADRVISVSTSLLPALKAGVVPDFVVALDGHPALAQHFSGLDPFHQALAETTLAWAPSVDPAIMDGWPGRQAAFCPDTPLFSELIGGTDRSKLFCSGTVTHCAVDLAVRLGAARVLLVGADFGFADGHTHVEDAVFRQEARATTTVPNGNGVPIPSTPALVGYLRDLETYLRSHPEVSFVSMSTEGAHIAGTRRLPPPEP